MSYPPTYKPSPLSFGSPRTSPFRRPESPASPSTIRPSTPTASPTKPQTPSKLQNTSTPTSNDGSWTPRGLNLPPITHREPPASPTRGPGSTGKPSTGLLSGQFNNGDALSKLPPAQVREMREAFQILDRDSDGHVNRDDVIDMLTSLGLDTSSPSLTPYFPPSLSAPPTLSLPSYLSTLSTLLLPLSAPAELLSAFSAFDTDDSGQIDLAELRDALLHTMPEVGGTVMSEREVDKVLGGFVGRRAFTGKGNGARGEVFRYGEFVGSVMGGGGGEGQGGGKEGEKAAV